MDQQKSYSTFTLETGDLHEDSVNLVARFAQNMASKMVLAQKKYGQTNNWATPGWGDECRQKLMAHLLKGDPMDVAIYAAFLWHHGESTRQGDANEFFGMPIKDLDRVLYALGNSYPAELNIKLEDGTLIKTSTGLAHDFISKVAESFGLLQKLQANKEYGRLSYERKKTDDTEGGGLD